MTWRTVIIGLGRMGMGYDFDDDTDAILTHARAIASHPAFALHAGIDSDPQRRLDFTEKYQRPAYASLAEIADPLDVIIIAVPTIFHRLAFETALQRSPRLIICEKPLATSFAEANAMVEASRTQGIGLLVNYMRRFDPGVTQLTKQIRQGNFGEIYKGTVWYSKGLLNNGSHFLDLLSLLIGPPGDFCVINSGTAWQDNDPQPDLKITYGAVDIFVMAAREECFSLGEIELLGCGGRMSYREFGQRIESRIVADDPNFPGYKILSSQVDIIPNDMMRYQWNVAAVADDWLAGRRLNLPSTGETALVTQTLIERIKERLHHD